GVRFVEITSVNKPPRIVGVPEGSRSRHIRAEPVAGLQREFHVLPVIAHRSAETLLCLAAPLRGRRRVSRKRASCSSSVARPGGVLSTQARNSSFGSEHHCDGS